jgi:hypothetical protein
MHSSRRRVLQGYDQGQQFQQSNFANPTPVQEGVGGYGDMGSMGGSSYGAPQGSLGGNLGGGGVGGGYGYGTGADGEEDYENEPPLLEGQ